MTDDAGGTRLLGGGNATVFVADLDRAVRFYTKTLGLDLLYRAGEHFAMVEADGMKIGLHPRGDHTPPAGADGGIQLGFDVRRPIAEVVEALRARGVVFDEHDGSAVVDDGPVKLAFFRDPDGTVAYLCEHA